MKSRIAIRAIGWVVGVLGLAALQPTAWGLTRTAAFDSTPPGARVVVDGQVKGETPSMPIKLEFKSGSTVVVELVLEDYQTQQVSISYEAAKDFKKDHRMPAVSLPQVRLVIPATIGTTVEGAEVAVNGVKVGPAPATTKLEFKRADGHAPWNTNIVSAVKLPRYAADSKAVTYEQARAGGASPLRVDLSPGEILREVKVAIHANEPDAEVKVDGVAVGKTPLEAHTFVFKRAAASEPWKPQELRVEKEAFEYLPPGQKEALPAFLQQVSADFKAPQIEVTGLVRMRSVRTPVRFYTVKPGQVDVLITNLWSQVEGRERATPVTAAAADEPLVVSRICGVPESPEDIVYIAPVYEQRAGATVKDRRIVGTHVVRQRGKGVTPLTDASQNFDMDPCVTANWLYFSSDRTRDRIIWRTPVSGKGGYTTVTGMHTKFDTEPALDKGETRLAYVSRLPDAPASSPSYIWIAEPDGKQATRYFPGRSPAWSPDGKRLAYVNPEGVLCWVELAVAQSPTLLTMTADYQVAWPTWLDEKRILFASNESKTGRSDRHFDIWLWDLDSNSKRALTSDESFDFAPAATDGGVVYFLSNRGATLPGQERLQIYSLTLEQASSQ